jgi:hypothetical protein
MSLAFNGPWILFLAGSDHFYVEVRPDPEVMKDDIYGPIPGHPAGKLDLAAWLRESANHADPGYARRVARDMVMSGDTLLTRLALDWIGELPMPSPPKEYELWTEAMENFLEKDPQSPTAQNVTKTLAKLRRDEATAEADWETKRETLADERYSAGEQIKEEDPTIIWGEAAENGLRLGIAGVPPGVTWKLGEAASFDVFVRNDGQTPVKFAWTPRQDEGLNANLIGSKGEYWQGSIVSYSTLLFYNRCQLDPGHLLKLKSGAQFHLVKLHADGTAPDKPEGNRFLVQGVGPCQLEIQCHLGIEDWMDSRGEAHPRPAGEWSGTLKANRIPVTLIGN